MKQLENQNYTIPLHDIKPIVDVHEYSLYYFLGLGFVVLLLLIGITYLIIRWIKNKNKFNLKKHHLSLINSADLKDTKNSAYTLSIYGATFKNDSDRHLEMYNNLLQRLEIYKYKKDVSSFDDEVIGYIELYKGMLDV